MGDRDPRRLGRRDGRRPGRARIREAGPCFDRRAQRERLPASLGVPYGAAQGDATGPGRRNHRPGRPQLVLAQMRRLFAASIQQIKDRFRETKHRGQRSKADRDRLERRRREDAHPFIVETNISL